jgi:hypothetical protein
LKLLVHDLDLFVDRFASEAIDRHVPPLVLLAFHDKAAFGFCAFGLR